MNKCLEKSYLRSFVTSPCMETKTECWRYPRAIRQVCDARLINMVVKQFLTILYNCVLKSFCSLTVNLFMLQNLKILEDQYDYHAKSADRFYDSQWLTLILLVGVSIGNDNTGRVISPTYSTFIENLSIQFMVTAKSLLKIEKRYLIYVNVA